VLDQKFWHESVEYYYLSEYLTRTGETISHAQMPLQKRYAFTYFVLNLSRVKESTWFLLLIEYPGKRRYFAPNKRYPENVSKLFYSFFNPKYLDNLVN
jgi:hypothetical protein